MFSLTYISSVFRRKKNCRVLTSFTFSTRAYPREGNFDFKKILKCIVGVKNPHQPFLLQNLSSRLPQPSSFPTTKVVNSFHPAGTSQWSARGHDLPSGHPWRRGSLAADALAATGAHVQRRLHAAWMKRRRTRSRWQQPASTPGTCLPSQIFPSRRWVPPDTPPPPLSPPSRYHWGDWFIVSLFFSGCLATGVEQVHYPCYFWNVRRLNSLESYREGWRGGESSWVQILLAASRRMDFKKTAHEMPPGVCQVCVLLTSAMLSV